MCSNNVILAVRFCGAFELLESLQYLYLTAGSLVLGEGGVCVVGNLSCYKKDLMEKLQHSETLPSLL